MDISNEYLKCLPNDNVLVKIDNKLIANEEENEKMRRVIDWVKTIQQINSNMYLIDKVN